MKVQCDVCQRAEATVLCCADEAALCRACDEDVHAANKLASKHQRVPLLLPSPSQSPSCDICQEKTGYFFCLEDRALLCRQCDAGVHTASPHVAAHQRFLVTGVRVALHQCVNETTTSTTTTTTTTTNNNNNNNSTSSNRPSSSEAASAIGSPGGFQGQWEWSEVLADSDQFEQHHDDFFGFSTKNSS